MQKYQSNACAKIVNKRIQVKTERDVEKQLGIKIEPNPITQSTVQAAPAVQKSNQSNKPLINKIMDLQKENQRYVLELKKKDTTHAELILEKQKTEDQLSEKVRSLTADLKTLESELSNIKVKSTEQEAKNKRTISDLHQKNRLLEANIKQLQTGICHQTKYHENQKQLNESDENVYEVEKIIGHKKNKNGMHFLVRWRNFSSKHDSWVREANLMCPEILKEYKRAMK